MAHLSNGTKRRIIAAMFRIAERRGLKLHGRHAESLLARAGRHTTLVELFEMMWVRHG